MERVLSSGRKVEGISSSVHRVLSSGRCLTDTQPQQKKQRTLYSQIGSILHENDVNHQELSSQIHVSERKPRENEPSKKLLLQAVSDANKSVMMKLKKTNGIVKVMKPDGTTECLTTKNLAKRLKAKEPIRIDPSSLTEKAEPVVGKMKIRIRNEYCSNTDEMDNDNQDNQSNERNPSSMDFEDDDEDEFIVVVNNDDDINNIWMLNDYPYDDNGNEYDENRTNLSLKRKLSDENISEENDEQEYSPLTNNQSGKKLKRCRFWPDCHNGEQCEFVHPNQRCTHFPNCAYGSECLYIHPSCRFGSACSRSGCLYTHSASTPASSPNDNANGSGRSAASRPESSTICKFGMQCMRPNCAYSHPRMPFPSARNYKWVNSKWRASDDVPLLPPTPKNTAYENPFLPKPPNSNDGSIEK